MTQTVIGLFDSRDSANAAEQALMKQGIDRSSIYFSQKEDTAAASGERGESMDAIRDFLSQVFGQENAQEADAYAKEIDQGCILVSVDLPDDADVEPVCDALEGAGAVDLGAPTGQQEAGGTAGAGQTTGEGGESIPIAEEQMQVGKREVGQGRVRVVSRLVETPVQEEVSLREERATVERRPADRPIDPQELEAQGERTIEVEETAEKPEVTKSARVTGEVEVGKETTEKSETVEDTVRRTEVDVEREPGAQGTGKRKPK